MHLSWEPTFVPKKSLGNQLAFPQKGPDCLSEQKETIQPGIFLYRLSVELPLRTSTLADLWLGCLSNFSMTNLLSASEANPAVV
ncbi:hypothetical protein TNCT_739041 [Trichonephila clavata]|uniref:Uncharacterized protein n=1 Tax=Trichonephila clavata TaxID=2740835 RepID=A0A8X6GWE9_TRICU|nr:hypothetical protein TNCT_739041 [Trichonephila clavata]